MSTLRAGAVTCIAIAALWFAAVRHMETLDAAPMPQVAPLSTDVQMQITGVKHYEVQEGSSGRRNLFGYVTPPPHVVVVTAAPIASPPPPIAPVIADAPIVAPPPRFEYRFIGRFGRERDPIAAFSAGGDVITVRRGDRINEQFTLRSIGPDSVEVVGGKGRVIRIRLGE